MRADDYQVQVAQVDDRTVVTVAGELDTYNAPKLKEVLADLIDRQGVTALEVDLDGVSFIDSTGLGVLVGALKRVRGQGGELVLARVPMSAYKVFEITGLASTFSLQPGT